ncbi:TIGR04211 family SH3 domain-containing protein [Pseudoalteromonas sp. SSDWG2]|uniref:TIGR04211 family SH3 domain-containing protein n=1 Tax=Pseudoalteromonas sp. SSDWG2 TaxID=3139391 RepID=UPI003BAC008B
MLKHLSIALIVFSSAFFAKQAYAESSTAYISDELYIFMHSGAGKNYRILGSVNAGTQVQLVTGTETNGFYEIVDDKERQGWVESQFINQGQSLKVKFEQLGEQLASTQQTLRDAQAQIPELQSLNTDLQTQNQQLQDQLAEAIAARDAVQTKQQSMQAKEKRQLLTYGGAIALISLLLGVILTIFLSRRKRYDGWA